LPHQEVLTTLRTVARSALVTFALAASAHAGNVWLNFSGGSGAPLTVTLPLPITYTVTNDTPNAGAVFVFQNVGDVTGGSVRAATGTMSYTVNAGGGNAINSLGALALGGIVGTNDLSLFRNSSPGVALNDVLLLSAGAVATTSNVSAAAPASGLYSAILTDGFGIQLGVGTGAPGPNGDYNVNGSVDAADYTLWRDTLGSTTDLRANGDNTGASAGKIDQADYALWKANFGTHAGSGSGAGESAAIPEPATLFMLVTGILAIFCRQLGAVS